MKKKIKGIGVCMLLIATIFSVAVSLNTIADENISVVS